MLEDPGLYNVPHFLEVGGVGSSKFVEIDDHKLTTTLSHSWCG